MNNKILGRGCALAAIAAALLAPGAASANILTRADAVDSVKNVIAQGDCATAVSRLKTGLSLEYPEMYELAGSMYEQGLCVRRDWQRAVTFYVQAHQAGVKSAASRLAAGYAERANGPDAAATLWWFALSGGHAPGNCAVSAADAGDPDRFVAALGAWPAKRIEACTYIVGVMATLNAELRYPDRAGEYGLGGEVALRFHPGLPRIDVRMGQSQEYTLLGVVDGDVLGDRRAKLVKNSFEEMLRKLADRALNRYPHPGGIAHDTVIDTRFNFVVEHM